MSRHLQGRALAWARRARAAEARDGWGSMYTLEMALEEVAIIVGHPLPAAARVEVVAQRRNDERLNLGGGYAADQSGGRGLSLQHGLGDVIAVAGAALVGVSWAHAVAAMVKQAPAPDGG